MGQDTGGATDTLWAELALACDTEMVLHLDDLLLRRTRLYRWVVVAGGPAAVVVLGLFWTLERTGWLG